jgi:hypothetical protein
MFDPTIGLTADRTNTSTSPLSSNNRANHGMMRRQCSLLTKEMKRSLYKKGQ